jgi:peroxiredoxin family protein
MPPVQHDEVAAMGDLKLEQRIEDLVERKVTERFERLQSSIDQTLAQVQAASEAGPTNRATLLIFSGDMDRAMSAFIIATGAAAMGMEVSMFFTFWGLSIIKKATVWSGKTVPQRLLAAMLPSGPAHAGISKLQMMGLGPMLLKKMMSEHHVETLPAFVSLAQEMGIRLIACQMSMGLMGITKEELLDDIDYGGVATYLADATDSRMTLFI